MREPNLGFTITCTVCGKNFWSEDGYSICSLNCDDIYQSESEEDEEC